MKERFKEKKKFRCPKCSSTSSHDQMNDYVPINLHGLAKELKEHLEIEENPKLQFCPRKTCRKPVDITNSKTNEPRGVTCE